MACCSKFRDPRPCSIIFEAPNARSNLQGCRAVGKFVEKSRQPAPDGVSAAASPVKVNSDTQNDRNRSGFLFEELSSKDSSLNPRLNFSFITDVFNAAKDDARAFDWSSRASPTGALSAVGTRPRYVPAISRRCRASGSDAARPWGAAHPRPQSRPPSALQQASLAALQSGRRGASHRAARSRSRRP